MLDGNVVVRDPRALRGLAHPVRLEILERLQSAGPATATEVGAAIGIGPSAASYHLRSLARFGLVEDAGGGIGRNRPWRAIGTGFAFEPAHDLRPASQAAAQLLSAQLVARGDSETLRFVERERTLEPEWRAASHIAHKTLSMTPEEATELMARIDELAAPFLRSVRTDGPAEARAVRLLLRLFPREEPR